MTDRQKIGTALNGRKQIKDGTIDEPLLSEEIIEKFRSMEERIAKLENQLGDLAKVDFLAVYEQAKK
jgi:hypothetical protein